MIELGAANITLPFGRIIADPILALIQADTSLCQLAQRSICQPDGKILKDNSLRHKPLLEQLQPSLLLESQLCFINVAKAPRSALEQA